MLYKCFWGFFAFIFEGMDVYYRSIDSNVCVFIHCIYQNLSSKLIKKQSLSASAYLHDITPFRNSNKTLGLLFILLAMTPRFLGMVEMTIWAACLQSMDTSSYNREERRSSWFVIFIFANVLFVTWFTFYYIGLYVVIKFHVGWKLKALYWIYLPYEVNHK